MASGSGGGAVTAVGIGLGLDLARDGELVLLLLGFDVVFFFVLIY